MPSKLMQRIENLHNTIEAEQLHLFLNKYEDTHELSSYLVMKNRLARNYMNNDDVDHIVAAAKSEILKAIIRKSPGNLVFRKDRTESFLFFPLAKFGGRQPEKKSDVYSAIHQKWSKYLKELASTEVRDNQSQHDSNLVLKRSTLYRQFGVETQKRVRSLTEYILDSYKKSEKFDIEDLYRKEPDLDIALRTGRVLEEVGIASAEHILRCKICLSEFNTYSDFGQAMIALANNQHKCGLDKTHEGAIVRPRYQIKE